LRVSLATIAHEKLTIPSHGLCAASGKSIHIYISGLTLSAGLTTSGPTSNSVSPISAIFAHEATFFVRHTTIHITVLMKTMTATESHGVRVVGTSESAWMVAAMMYVGAKASMRTIVE
jgi:hypothetical protein|tara:strand:+ start:272 stop:625 length:354 start_codon:yes stop_codon:yes gene_type:complete